MPENITKTELARLLDIDKSYIPKLIKRGMPVNNNGTLPKVAAERWYKENILARRKKTKPTSQVNPNSTDVDEVRPEAWPPDMTRQEADRRLQILRAKREDIALRKERGELIEAQSVLDVWGGRVSAAKARLLLIPPAITARFGAEVGDEVARIIDEALHC